MSAIQGAKILKISWSDLTGGYKKGNVLWRIQSM